MKNYLNLSLILALSGVLFFGCSKDEFAPTITDLQVNGLEVTNGQEALVQQDSEATITFTASDDTKLSAYDCRINNVSFASGDLSGSSENVSVEIPASELTQETGTILPVNICAEDKRESLGCYVFGMVIVRFGPISTYSSIDLEVGAADPYMFFSTTTGERYRLSEAAANAGVIDIAYVFDGTGRFVSPANIADYGYTAFTGARDTKFAAQGTIDLSEFAVMADASDLTRFTSGGGNAAINNTSFQGSFSFTTADNKKGMISVQNFTAGTVRFTAKVEE